MTQPIHVDPTAVIARYRAKLAEATETTVLLEVALAAAEQRAAALEQLLDEVRTDQAAAPAPAADGGVSDGDA